MNEATFTVSVPVMVEGQIGKRDYLFTLDYAGCYVCHECQSFICANTAAITQHVKIFHSDEHMDGPQLSYAFARASMLALYIAMNEIKKRLDIEPI